MADFVVKCLSSCDYENWDTLVAQSPQGTVFHKTYWLKASDKDFRIYGCFKNGDLFAGLPIIIKKRFGIEHASHPPLTPYLGIVFRKSQAKYVKRISEEKEITKAIAAKIKADLRLIKFHTTPLPTDLQPFIWEGFSCGVRYTYLLDLNDIEKAWQQMDARRRNDITRAEKDGIYIDTNCTFEETFTLVEKTFTRQSQEPLFKSTAFRYHEALNSRNQCKSFLAKNKQGKAIAVAYIIWDEKRSYYLLGGYDPQEKHHGASAKAIWEAIKFTKEQLGLDQFDFEGSMMKPVEKFFRKFGGNMTPYYTVFWASPLVKCWQAIKNSISVFKLK